MGYILLAPPVSHIPVHAKAQDSNHQTQNLYKQSLLTCPQTQDRVTSLPKFWLTTVQFVSSNDSPLCAVRRREGQRDVGRGIKKVYERTVPM